MNVKQLLADTAKQVSIVAVRAAAEMNGSYFFSAGAMRFFKSRLSDSAFWNHDKTVAYFVTSEQGPYGDRAYNVRMWRNGTGNISTVGEFQAYATRHQALAAICAILSARTRWQSTICGRTSRLSLSSCTPTHSPPRNRNEH
jgi:hypothetical protein